MAAIVGATGGAEPEAAAASPVLTDLMSRLRPVLQRYYPTARSQVRGNLLEFEHETRVFLVHIPLKTGEWQEAREIRGPNHGGILCTIDLRDGRYDGPAVLPQTFNERYFETLVMAEASHGPIELPVCPLVVSGWRGRPVPRRIPRSSPKRVEGAAWPPNPRMPLTGASHAMAPAADPECPDIRGR